jgi:hypothetical protein
MGDLVYYLRVLCYLLGVYLCAFSKLLFIGTNKVVFSILKLYNKMLLLFRHLLSSDIKFMLKIFDCSRLTVFRNGPNFFA